MNPGSKILYSGFYVTDNSPRIMATEPHSINGLSMNVMCVVYGVLALEVPAVRFTTQGVSPRRDVV